MHDPMTIEDKVRSYIIDTFLTQAEAERFRNDDDLLEILDSLKLLRMVMHLESTFTVKVDNSELSAEHLGSVDKIAAFVAKKAQCT
jgi:acyl carrier protein